MAIVYKNTFIHIRIEPSNNKTHLILKLVCFRIYSWLKKFETLWFVLIFYFKRGDPPPLLADPVR